MPPRKARQTRNLEQTRRTILGVAFDKVYRHGFQGVSIDTIVAETDLTKGAFYHHFPTKLDLGYALVDEVIKPMIIERWITPLEEFRNPMEGMLALLRRHIDPKQPGIFDYGCPLNNLVQEMAPVDAGFRVRLQAALELWITETKAVILLAKERKFVRRDVDADALAIFIVMAHEGFFGLLKGLRDPKVFEALYKSLEAYFGALS